MNGLTYVKWTFPYIVTYEINDTFIAWIRQIKEKISSTTATQFFCSNKVRKVMFESNFSFYSDCHTFSNKLDLCGNVKSVKRHIETREIDRENDSYTDTIWLSKFMCWFYVLDTVPRRLIVDLMIQPIPFLRQSPIFLTLLFLPLPIFLLSFVYLYVFFLSLSLFSISLFLCFAWCMPYVQWYMYTHMCWVCVYSVASAVICSFSFFHSRSEHLAPLTRMFVNYTLAI